jgi:hypothetical protein
VTAKNIARALGIGYTKSPGKFDIVVVRYGYSRKHIRDFALNTAPAVNLASDGLKSLQVLHEKGVPCVEPVINPGREDYPLVGRKLRNHVAGKTLSVLTQPPEESFEESFKYYTRYREISKEFRVHVFNSRVLKAFRKVPRAENPHPKIRTSQRGWGYKKVNWSKYYAAGTEVAVLAVQTLGLTYAGVDMAKGKDGSWFVIEVNTGPALNSKTLPLYASRFNAHLLNLQATGKILYREVYNE